MVIQWTPVESSNVAAIGYENHDDELKAELYVRFKSGLEYVYHDVPAGVVQEFLDADSKGKYLNEHIKGAYAYEKIG